MPLLFRQRQSKLFAGAAVPELFRRDQSVSISGLEQRFRVPWWPGGFCTCDACRRIVIHIAPGFGEFVSPGSHPVIERHVQVLSEVSHRIPDELGQKLFRRFFR